MGRVSRGARAGVFTIFLLEDSIDVRLQADIRCHMVLSTEQNLGVLNGLFNETVSQGICYKQRLGTTLVPSH